MDGPAGVSHLSEGMSPPMAERAPTAPASRAICSGVRANGRAVAPGLIGSEERSGDKNTKFGGFAN